QKEEEVGGTAVEAMAGDWFVTVSRSVDGDEESHEAHFSTYNTAANSASEMWLDDLESFWQAKGKIGVDLASMTFSTDAPVQNEYYDMTFEVANGKILKGAARGPGSNTPTDSIYFELTFSDDTDADGNLIETPWVVSGYKRTGFLDDEL